MRFDAIDRIRKLPVRLRRDNMPLQLAKKTKPPNEPIKRPSRASRPTPEHTPARHATWERLPEQDKPECERGEEAVLHVGATRGRRSDQFPDLNITATAARLGVTKSHLAKVLSGINRPSIELAVRLAAALGKDVNYVIGLYKPKETRTKE